jgi:hypothetical protein
MESTHARMEGARKEHEQAAHGTSESPNTPEN